jgi:hypothetical protein
MGAFLTRRMEHVVDLDGDRRQRERHPGVPTTNATPTPCPAPPRAHAQYHPHPDDHRGYDHHAHAQYAPQPLPIVHGGYLPYQLPGTMLSAPMAPPSGGPVGGGDGGGSVIQVAHTDDAATKLSDWVRRRCFNCCTADTSTWRLVLGKVASRIPCSSFTFANDNAQLCKKCGVFERTYSCPRPEQLRTSAALSRPPLFARVARPWLR